MSTNIEDPKTSAFDQIPERDQKHLLNRYVKKDYSDLSEEQMRGAIEHLNETFKNAKIKKYLGVLAEKEIINFIRKQKTEWSDRIIP